MVICGGIISLQEWKEEHAKPQNLSRKMRYAFCVINEKII